MKTGKSWKNLTPRPPSSVKAYAGTQVFANFAKSGRVSMDDFFEIVGQFRAHYGKKDGKNVRTAYSPSYEI